MKHTIILSMIMQELNTPKLLGVYDFSELRKNAGPEHTTIFELRAMVVVSLH